MPEKALKTVAAKYHLTAEQAAEILRLLDAGFSVPYIMRYHKELAGALEADGFYELMEERRRLEKLDSRRRKMLKKLREREILTDELEEKISRASDVRELIDHYVPYRPRKRSRSRQALAQGLQPLAAQVLSQEQFIPEMALAAEPCVDPEKGLDDLPAVLEGVFHIVSDWVAEERSHRDRQRAVFRQEAEIVVRRLSRSLPGRLAREFKQYFDFRQKVAKLHPYHMLSILRGKRLRVLQYRFEPPVEAMVRAAAELYFAGGVAQWEQIRNEMGTELGDCFDATVPKRRFHGKSPREPGYWIVRGPNLSKLKLLTRTPKGSQEREGTTWDGPYETVEDARAAMTVEERQSYQRIEMRLAEDARLEQEEAERWRQTAARVAIAALPVLPG